MPIFASITNAVVTDLFMSDSVDFLPLGEYVPAHRAVYVGCPYENGAFVGVVDPGPEPEPAPPPPPTDPAELLTEAQKNLKARVTARRWEAETGGLALPDGTKINTGIDDQNRIASALQGMSRAEMTEVDFKGVDGWVKLTAAELSGVAAAIAGHVQACFSHERALHEAVDACESIADLQSVDINTGWPGTDTPAPEATPGTEATEPISPTGPASEATT